jgi:tripartite-type tricarboxylate transporter receptor subunit TctC
MARTLAAEMKDRLGQPMIVENRAGAGGNIGAEYVARAEADGHTLLFGTSGPLAINASLYRKINYDPVKSFAPVIQVGYLPNILVVNPALPVKTVPELVAYAKANPGKLSFGSVGIGSAHHLAGEAFKQRAGIDIVHVPYRGSAPVLQDLMGGQIQMAFDATALQLVREGRVRALAVASSKRWPDAPEIPAMSEVGFPDFQFGGWFGLFAPAGTPRPIVERINKEVNRILQMPDVKQRLNEIGLEPLGGTPEQLAEHVTRELAKWPALVKASGAQIN